MLNPLAGLLFVLFWLVHEISVRKRLGLNPGSWRAAYKISLKKEAPDPRVPAAIFAISTVFIFSFWESILRFLVQRQLSLWFFFPGVVLAAFALAFRKQSFESSIEKGRVTRTDVWLLVAAWALIMGSGLSLLLSPWLVWRTKFLPRRFQQYL